MGISRPFNVKHNYHAKVDPKNPVGFSVRLPRTSDRDSVKHISLQGLPPGWEILLQHSGISKEEVQAHPQEV